MTDDHVSPRAACEQDISDIVKIYREGRWVNDREIHPTYALATYKDDQFYRDFENKLKKRIEAGNQVFVAEHEGKIAGFAIVSEADEYPTRIITDFNKASELHQIYVDPDYQGHGFGRSLFEACRGKAANDNKETMLINVLGSKEKRNERAITFYYNRGARPLGTVVEQKERSGATHELHCLVMGLKI